MGTYNDIKSKFDAINQALNDKGYKRYSGYYTFAPPSGFAIGSIMYASDINTMINDLQQNQRGLSYSTYPISTVQKGSYIKRNILVQLQQYYDDVTQLRDCKNCSNVCTTNCYNGCHNCTGGCTGSCTGCSGCNGNCYSCSGGLWCVKCHGCTGCGGCGGCGGCSGNCQNECQGYTSCSSNCNSGCNVNCSSGCKSSCTSGCANTSRIGE